MRLDHHGADEHSYSLVGLNLLHEVVGHACGEGRAAHQDGYAGSDLGERRSQLPCGVPGAHFAGADRAHSACFRQASAIEHSLPHETVGSTCLQLRASDPRGDDYRTAAGVGRQGIEP